MAFRINDELQKAHRDLLLVCAPILFITQLGIDVSNLHILGVDMPNDKLISIGWILWVYCLIRWLIYFIGNFTDWRADVGYVKRIYRAGPRQTYPEAIETMMEDLKNSFRDVRYRVDNASKFDYQEMLSELKGISNHEAYPFEHGPTRC